MALQKIFLLIFLLPALTYSQTIKVKKETSRIDGEIADGYGISLEAPEPAVHNSLAKYLKSVGKIKQSDHVITISEPLIAGEKYPYPLYSTSWQTGTTTSAWVGINMNEWDDEANTMDKRLEKLIYDFGVNFQREKIQIQIDESLRALQTVEKQQSRLVNQNKDLTNKIEGNKREKINLEKSLVNNGLAFEDLTKKLAQNKKSQDSVATAGEQIKKVVEMHKARQQEVH